VLLSNTVLAQEPIKIYDSKVGQSIIVLADNLEAFPYTIKLEIKQKGLTLQEPLPDYFVVPGNSKGLEITRLNFKENSSWQISYKFQYMEGDADAIHDNDYVYQLPFKDAKFIMSQGYNGTSTHQGINALDFTMPKGQIILAARNGLVVKVKEDSNLGCPSGECMNQGNFVRILHDDGTMAEYHHLEFNGALVAVGDIIEQGQEVGNCGATGYATGPHLHFIVFKTDGIKQITIKTKFKYSPDKIGYLQEGNMYTAF